MRQFGVFARSQAVTAARSAKAGPQARPALLLFEANSQSKRPLTICKRLDSLLREVFTAPAGLKEHGPSTLQLKFKGTGSGERPLFKHTKSPTIGRPSRLSIEIEGPRFGTLDCEAKFGPAGQQPCKTA